MYTLQLVTKTVKTWQDRLKEFQMIIQWWHGTENSGIYRELKQLTVLQIELTGNFERTLKSNASFTAASWNKYQTAIPFEWRLLKKWLWEHLHFILYLRLWTKCEQAFNAFICKLSIKYLNSQHFLHYDYPTCLAAFANLSLKYFPQRRIFNL
jgi:hypothetical protein